jgi:hypothetical protein
MSRTDCNQAAQRAKHRRRRRARGPAEVKHGSRSQSGVKIRSVAAWKAWRKGPHQAAVDEAARREQLRADWRKRAAEKHA